MDANSVHEVAATLREVAELLEQPVSAPQEKVASNITEEVLDSQEVLNFLKFFG